MKYCIGLMLTLTTAWLLPASEASSQKRITESAAVLGEIMGAKDKGIPEDLLEKAQCVGIIPGLKRAGVVIGGKYGKGVVVCRTSNGWSGPSTERIEGGSIGLQIGAGETDVVFLVMNQRGMDKLMGDKFTLGADASAMAGPVGRSAEARTDATMHAEILAYSRARGVFAGVSLEGATLRPDNENNRMIYGREVTQTEILKGGVKPPASAAPLYAELNRYAPSRHSASR
ncbi:MAG TPA: lipid-binding SYLF domain-containing protein [Bryobacteraceae bacterium]|nr:lipid-binding SYLF domain-containing protein [Bryobacteraceae bacterium]